MQFHALPTPSRTRKFLTTSSLAGLAISMSMSMSGCGGGEAESNGPITTMEQEIQTAPPSATQPTRILPKPVLSFTDTGLSVTDGVTRVGAWQVSSLEGWEYSFDMGNNWVRGQGDYFDVVGDGAKTIWVRARDDMGNTSEIVMISCVLDTTPPTAIRTDVQLQSQTRLVNVAGVEFEGRWEYSVDDQRSWFPGSGDRLAVMGNALPAIWLRQVDLAGNPSASNRVDLFDPESPTWHEASSHPDQPSFLPLNGARTVILHGSVLQGDADYIRWDTPAGQRLQSIRLIRYASADPIAFFALQRSPVFDAGFDVSRMLTYGHIGPQDLARNVLQAIAPIQLGPGAVTLWFQQTGPQVTDYAIELTFEPAE